MVDEIFYVLLSIVLFVIFIARLREPGVPIRASLGFGVVAAILSFLGQTNAFSLLE